MTLFTILRRGLLAALVSLPLLAVATAEQNLVEAVEHARALMHPTQALMPEALTAALETVIAVSEQNRVEETRAHLNYSLKLAQEMGYL